MDVGNYVMVLKFSAYSGNCEIGTFNEILPVVVVNLFGLNALQSNILGVVSGFLGKALTLPGILAIW